jgi:hypothetical protein
MNWDFSNSEILIFDEMTSLIEMNRLEESKSARNE